MNRWPEPQNCRKYGDIMVGLTRTWEYTWYSVIGKKMLLNFLIDREGRRHEIWNTTRIN